MHRGRSRRPTERPHDLAKSRLAGHHAFAYAVPEHPAGCRRVPGPSLLSQQYATERAASGRAWDAPAISRRGVVNGALTMPITVTVVPVAPGVAAYSDGSVIAQHSDYSLVNASSPAHPGESLMIYLVGMGATNPAVPSDTPAPGLKIGDTLASGCRSTRGHGEQSDRAYSIRGPDAGRDRAVPDQLRRACECSCG